MRFILILLVLVPMLMACRTLGLFRDWLALRRWAREGDRAAGPPLLHEPVAPDADPTEAAAAGFTKFLLSGLSAAAAGCFALAGGLVVLSAME